MRRILRVAGLAGVSALALAACLSVIGAGAVRAGGGIPAKKDVKPKTPPPKQPDSPGSLLPARGRRGGDAADAAPSRREKDLAVAAVVPRGAALFVRVPEISRLRNIVDELALSRILDEPLVGDPIDRALGRFRASAETSPHSGLAGMLQMALAANVDYGAAKSLFREELALAVLPARAGAEEAKEPRLAAALTMGPNREAINEFVEDFLGEIIDRFAQIRRAPVEQRGGAKIRGLELGTSRVQLAYYENLLLIGTGRGTVAELIGTELSGETASVAGDPGYVAAMDDLGKGAHVLYRLDVAALLKTALGGMLPAGTPLVPAEGKAGTLWGAVYADGSAVREKMTFRAAEGGKLPLAAPGQALSAPPRSIAYFPVDTIAYHATVHQEEAKDSVVRALEASGIPLGDADVRNEILASLDGEMAAGIILPHGRPVEFLLAFEVGRGGLPAKASEALERAGVAAARALLRTKALLEFKTTPHREEEIHYLDFAKGSPATEGRRKPGLAYARSRRLGREFLLVSSGRRALEKALRQKRFAPSSLPKKSDFVRATAGLRPRRTQMLYVDTRRVVEAVVGDALSGLATALGGEASSAGARQAARGLGGLGASVGRIQDALSPHLSGLALVSDVTAESVVIESRGPVGPVTGALAASLAFLTAGVTGDAGETIVPDRENLEKIGVGIQLYVTDFDRLPTALSELYDEYVPELDTFMAPSGKGGVKGKDDIDERGDYVYLTGLRPTDLSDAMVVYSKRYVHGGLGRNVLLLDGRVRFYDESAFGYLIEQQRRAVERR